MTNLLTSDAEFDSLTSATEERATLRAVAERTDKLGIVLADRCSRGWRSSSTANRALPEWNRHARIGSTRVMRDDGDEEAGVKQVGPVTPLQEVEQLLSTMARLLKRRRCSSGSSVIWVTRSPALTPPQMFAAASRASFAPGFPCGYWFRRDTWESAKQTYCAAIQPCARKT